MSIWIPLGFTFFTCGFWYLWEIGWLGDWTRTGVPIWTCILGAIFTVATWAIYLFSHLKWVP